MGIEDGTQDKKDDAFLGQIFQPDEKPMKNRITKMVNCFKYYVSKEGEQPDKAARAKQALAMYEAIHGNGQVAQAQRRSFLAQFEGGGGGRGKDGLKWVVDYKKTAVHEDKKSLSTTDNYFTRHSCIII